MDELLARIEVLSADRDAIALRMINEHRPLSDDEIRELAKLDAAITASLNAANHLRNTAGKDARPTGTPSSVEDYRTKAAVFNQFHRDNYHFVFQLVGNYGQWLLATIAAAHLGGMFLIGGLSDLSWAAREPSMWALLVGLLLVLSSGLFTYWNWSLHTFLYERLTNVNILTDPSALPPDGNSQILGKINATARWAIGIAALSAACLLLAGVLLSWLN